MKMGGPGYQLARPAEEGGQDIRDGGTVCRDGLWVEETPGPRCERHGLVHLAHGLIHHHAGRGHELHPGVALGCLADDPPKRRVREALFCRPGGLMCLASRVNQLKPLAKLDGQALRVVSAYIQAAALRRSVRGEGRDDYRAAGRNRSGNCGKVLASLRRFEQKMEERAIVPEVM